MNLLRTLAAVAVVAGHLRVLLFKDLAEVRGIVGPFGEAFYALTALGREAVIVFFVLSGYWVGGSVVRSVRSGHFDAAGYAVRRLARLYAVLVPALFLTACLGLVVIGVLGASDVARGHPGYHGAAVPHLADRLSPVALFGNLVFLQTIAVPEYGADGPLWSLAYEFWYYVLFPLMALLWYTKPIRQRALLALVLVLACFVAGPEILRMFPAWLLGAALGVWANPVSSFLSRVRSSALAVLQLAASLLLVGSAVLSRAGALGAYSSALVSVTAAALLALLLPDVRWVGRAWWPARLGAAYAHASYSLYLIHLPVAACAVAAFHPNVSDRWSPSPLRYLAFSAALVAILLLALLFASLTEFHTDDLRRVLERRLNSTRGHLRIAVGNIPGMPDDTVGLHEGEKTPPPR